MRDVSQAAEFVGRVKAIERVDLRARVAGFLGSRLFQEGGEVTKGQVVFELDPAPFEAVVQQRQATVQAAQATVTLADVQAQRARELVRTNAASAAQLDQREAELAQAQANLALAQAELRAAGIDLSYTKINTPISGWVGTATVTPGNLVGPDTGVLAVVVDRDPISVTFAATQRQLMEYRREVGSEDPNELTAGLRLADGSRYDQTGHIDFLGAQADPQTDSVPMRAVFPNPKHILVDGMSVRVVLEARKPERVLVIPQAAIALDQSGAYVFVVGADNKTEQRRVKVETQRDGSVVVRDGLALGDKVIVQGQARVRPGMVVAPTANPAQG